jgi:hypothetical protein
MARNVLRSWTGILSPLAAFAVFPTTDFTSRSAGCIVKTAAAGVLLAFTLGHAGQAQVCGKS